MTGDAQPTAAPETVACQRGVAGVAAEAAEPKLTRPVVASVTTATESERRDRMMWEDSSEKEYVLRRVIGRAVRDLKVPDRPAGLETPGSVPFPPFRPAGH